MDVTLNVSKTTSSVVCITMSFYISKNFQRNLKNKYSTVNRKYSSLTNNSQT